MHSVNNGDVCDIQNRKSAKKKLNNSSSNAPDLELHEIMFSLSLDLIKQLNTSYFIGII